MIKSKVVIKKVWRSELGGVALFLFLSVLCVILSHKIPALTLKDDIMTIGSYEVVLALPMLWFAPFISLCMTAFKIYNVSYKVDNRGVEMVEGRISLKQTTNSARYEDIRAIDVHQTVVERMLDIGTIEVATAATAQTEVFFWGIEAPYEIKNMLERERDARFRNQTEQ